MPKKSLIPNKPREEWTKDEELAYLRMENAYLKKLWALIQEDEKQRQKEEAAALKAAEREAENRRKTMERAARAATTSVAHSVSTNIVNSVMGGKQTDTKTIMKRAATSALSSVMRN